MRDDGGGRLAWGRVCREGEIKSRLLFPWGKRGRLSGRRRIRALCRKTSFGNLEKGEDAETPEKIIVP